MDYLVDELIEKLDTMISDMEEHDRFFDIALEYAQQLRDELNDLKEDDEADV